jgi:putative phosphoesterase
MKVLILSDVHANWPALEAVIRAERSWDEVVFCGDAVDYGPHPVECVRWLRANTTHAVRGNHDNALAYFVDCRCMGGYRPYSLATRAWHRSLLGGEDIAYLRDLLAIDLFERGGVHFRVSHATPLGGMYEYLTPENWERSVADIASDFVLIGHTHIQGVRVFGRVTVANPGSVGLARDFGGEACYGVIEDGRLALRRVPYDTERTVAALRAAPLSPQIIEGLVQAVTTGRVGA